jgi:hypothetical protein
MALTKSQIKKQWYFTNGCFRKALLDHYGKLLAPIERRLNLRDLKFLLAQFDWPINIPEINQLYMKNVLSLSTERLNLILEAASICNRKQTTIDAIMTELFERSMDSETKGDHG